MNQQTVVARLERAGDSAVLTLSGSLTVWSAPEAKKAFCDALSEAGRVEVDLGALDEADITALQLVCAAHRAALARSKTLVLRDAGAVTSRLARSAGFVRHRGCQADCLWVKEM